MQEITYENLNRRLLEAIPQFRPDEEDVADQRGILVFEDLAQFVWQEVERENRDELIGRIFRFIEAAASSSDVCVLDAIYSFLQGLATSPYHLKVTKKYMGPRTRKLLKDAQRYLST